jgi:glycosyltransferase involved in cell wall biosynthesis
LREGSTAFFEKKAAKKLLLPLVPGVSTTSALKEQKFFAPLFSKKAAPCLTDYLILIPTYNSGPKLLETVTDSLRHGLSVWVVIDGSTDGSAENLPPAPNLRVIHRSCNGGKGAAVLDGLRAAAGFTHVLVMDGDGQHPAALIPEFIALSRRQPDAMILGQPIFDSSAPRLRVIGRRLSNALAKIETLGAIGDSLFGFRIYPVAALLAVMNASPRMRKFDFDAEAAVRLAWRGVPAINRPAPVRYFRPDEGGVSHFRYGRDNILLTTMHARLILESLFQLPRLVLRRLRSSHR